MEEMREVAMAYYDNMSSDEKQLILNFYQALDANGDGKVTTDEFLGFMSKSGVQEGPENFFKLLDANKDGTLDFQECVTLFYMGTCGRLVFCDGCGSYLFGVHFLCVECYNVGKESTYDLCCSCYRNKNFNHVHSTFLDNYALLRTRPWEDEDDTSEQVDTTNEQASSPPSVSSSRSRDRPSKREKIKEAVEGFELGYQVGTLAANIATSCTTM